MTLLQMLMKKLNAKKPSALITLVLGISTLPEPEMALHVSFLEPHIHRRIKYLCWEFHLTLTNMVWP